MPSYETAPYRRWNPQPNWLSCHWHPPQHNQKFRCRIDDVEFEAYHYGRDPQLQRTRWVETETNRVLSAEEVSKLEYLAPR